MWERQLADLIDGPEHALRCCRSVVLLVTVTGAAGELVGRLTVSGHGACGGIMSRDPSQLCLIHVFTSSAQHPNREFALHSAVASPAPPPHIYSLGTGLMAFLCSIYLPPPGCLLCVVASLRRRRL